eukprot:g4009.t1
MAPGGSFDPGWWDLTGCFWSNFIFCSTGVFQVVMIQWLDYHGVDGAHTGLTVLSSYLGMLLFAVPFMFTRTGSRNGAAPKYHRLFPVVISVDVLANICNQMSISMCGSMLFMVIYSSIIVFAAVIRWRVFGKPLSHQQSLALAIITIGLAITAFDGAETQSVSASALNGSYAADFVSSSASASSSPSAVSPQSNARVLFTPQSSGLDGPVDPAKIVIGMCLALMGAFGYAVVYVLSEQVTVQDNAPDPFAFASFSGFYGSAAVAFYIVTMVGPEWQKLVIAPMEAKQTPYYIVCGVYMGLLIMCGAHNVSFVFLGKNGGGAVVAGVNKAVQTISVFVASAIWFGPEHPEQRMTTFKVFALILVVFGVLVYSAAPNVKGKSPTRIGGSAKDAQHKLDQESQAKPMMVEMSSGEISKPSGKLSQRGGYSSLQVVDLDEA